MHTLRSSMFIHARQIVLLTLLVVFTFTCLQPVIPLVHGAEPKEPNPPSAAEQKALLEYPNWVANACAVGASVAVKVSSGLVVGDSITVGAKDKIERKLEASDVDVTIDASTSRSLTRPGQDGNKLTGLGALNSADGKAAIEKSSAVVIALGTNGESSTSVFKEKVKEAILAVKSVNGSAKIYWVNIFSDVPQKNSYNTALKDLSGSEGFTVINAADANIELGSDKIHPTSKGSQDFGNAIVDVFNTGGATSDSNEEATADIDMSKLSLSEKIGQLMFVGVKSKTDAVELARKYQIGGIMLVEGGDSLYSKEAIDEVKKAGKIPVLVASDEEGGLVQRLESKTGKYPSAKELGAKSDSEVENIAKEYGKKLANIGVTVDYAPVVDIDDGNNPIISDTKRAFSSDPDKVADKASAFAKGLRSSKVVPVFKHFPGHGRASGDSHNQAVTTPSLSSLKDKDLKPYEKVLEASPSGVMMGHLIVPGLTGGKQATISSDAVDLLRKDYNFDGVIFSDEIANMKAIADKYSPTEAVSLAIQAGIDMPLFNYSSRYSNLDEQVGKTINRVEQDVKNGKISESAIDKALGRIEKLKALSGDKAVEESGAAAGCKCNVPGGTNTEEGENRIETAFLFLQGNDINFTPQQAAGVVGSLRFESGSALDPKATNPSSGAFGIAQWLGGRLTDLKTFGGSDYDKFEKQLEYLKKELLGSYYKPLAYDKIKEVSDYKEAQHLWTLWFEGLSQSPGQWHTEARNRYAHEVLTKYGSSSGGGGGSTDITCNTDSEGSGEVTGEYSLPVPKKWFTQSKEWFTKPHHDYPAADIPVPSGTKIFAVAKGKVTAANQVGYNGGMGTSVLITDGDILYEYYHGTPGSIKVKAGDSVKPGDLLMMSDNTGSSTGPHLHFEIEVKGVKACPQNLLVAIGENKAVPDIKSLPQSGCTY